MKKTILYSGLMALFVSLSAFGILHHFSNAKKVNIQYLPPMLGTKALYTTDKDGDIVPLDFTKVAGKVRQAVVHIKSISNQPANGYMSNPGNPFQDFFGQDPFQDFFNRRYQFRQSPQQRGPIELGQGSGVIISTDGYIVTNYHVIKNADKIEVALHDNRSFPAKLIGTDPSTDLALLKIEEKDLVSVAFSDSDKVEVGEWVLAVGNPFNLTSTVTAGIVSAKGRNINILKDQYAIESFIQTDAAINPGNSGGALVDLAGGLIGINTAIASPTGAYSGYGFAVPSNIVSKIIADLMEYGVVQRAVLGVQIKNIDQALAEEKGLSLHKGAYVDSLMAGSAAGEAGIKAGDIITMVEGKEVESAQKLQEMIARYRPGDAVTIKVDRNGKEKTFKVLLNNRNGNQSLKSASAAEIWKDLGVELENIDATTAHQLGLDGAVKIKKLFPGKLKQFTNIREGFIITKIDGQPIKDIDSLQKVLENKSGGVMLEGLYEDKRGSYFYAFGL